MDAKQFAAAVTREARKAWVNCTVTVDGRSVGIKARGKWIQRMEWEGKRDGAEFKSQAAMREWIAQRLTA